MSGVATLQRLVFPDPALGPETRLWVRLEGDVGVGDALSFGAGGRAGFDTYFNGLNLGTWTRHCRMDGLWLGLEGTGRFALEVRRATAPGTAETVHAGEVALDGGARVDLSGALAAGEGLLSFALTALGPGRLSGGGFETRVAGADRPRIAISITTFRREAQLRDTVERLQAFLDGFEHGQDIRIVVVDNGRSVALPDLPSVTVLENPNLGGAGGFARGLAHAIDTGASHVLFMDDDAAFAMENVRRAHAFLWLARDDRTALAGAMISNARPWAMWENGSIFHRSCRPQHNGVDLRDAGELARMELDAAREKPWNFYGGWWFFAFPTAHVRHFPFPFFVRGDDISFSLAHDFRTATLTGVASFQDDFPAKESPLTAYLDLRNHLVHHLVFPRLDIGRWRTAWIAWRFTLRSVARFHYEAAAAQLLAWEDVLAGPESFARHADMAERRETVKRLTRNEIWHPAETLPEDGQPVRDSPGAMLPQRVAALSLNGHLMPFYGLWARRVRVPVTHRGLLWPIWGAREITYLDAGGGKGYTTRMSRRRFGRAFARLAGLTWRFTRDYGRLKAEYRARYPDLASRAFWETRFDPPVEEATVEEAGVEEARVEEARVEDACVDAPRTGTARC